MYTWKKPINVIWTINDSFWDMGLPKWILQRAGDCQDFMGLKWAKDLSGTRVGVIVIPGQHCTDRYEELNQAADCFKRVIFMIVGDEEAKFRSSKLQHPDKRIWWFAPPFNPPQICHRVAPFGWPMGALDFIGISRRQEKDRDFDLSFAGQVTHERRVACVDAAHQVQANKFIFPTVGFAKGLPRDDYYSFMARSKFVLCPSGPCTPDSFRFAEALECGCVPIVDGRAPNPTYPEGYWDFLFDETELPFPVITDWSTLPQVFPPLLEKFDELQKACGAWWSYWRERYVLHMHEDLNV